MPESGIGEEIRVAGREEVPAVVVVVEAIVTECTRRRDRRRAVMVGSERWGGLVCGVFALCVTKGRDRMSRYWDVTLAVLFSERYILSTTLSKRKVPPPPPPRQQ